VQTKDKVASWSIVVVSGVANVVVLSVVSSARARGLEPHRVHDTCVD